MAERIQNAVHRWMLAVLDLDPLAYRFVPLGKTSDWSSKSSIGSFFVSTVNSAIDIADDATAGPVECECDRTLAVAAATMARATVTAIIIGFVMGTPSCRKAVAPVRITSVR
jgi:hypothetical protein